MWGWFSVLALLMRSQRARNLVKRAGVGALAGVVGLAAVLAALGIFLARMNASGHRSES